MEYDEGGYKETPNHITTRLKQDAPYVAPLNRSFMSISSNFSDSDGDGMKWGGGGWIIEPEEGHVFGVTSREQPFLTLEINLRFAEAAKHTYPRYVLD
jgi:hypothetical protein